MTIPDDVARPGALLTPQGKVLFDFLIFRDGAGGYLIDSMPRRRAGDLLRRLTMYKLRAKAEIAESDQSLAAISWQTDSTAEGGRVVADSRFPADLHVMRHYGAAPAGEDDADGWTALRIAHGIAESGSDFALSDAFPHDILLRPERRRRFQEGLLCRPGGRLADAASRHRAAPPDDREWRHAPSRVGHGAGGRRQDGRRARIGGRKYRRWRSCVSIAPRMRWMPALQSPRRGNPVTLTLPPDVGYRWPEEAADQGD